MTDTTTTTPESPAGSSGATGLDRRVALGLGLALASAVMFSTSGSFAKGLLQAGWSPAAAVTWRVSVASLLLIGPVVLSMRGRWHLMRRGWPSVVIFGVVAVAACQLAYFQAIERLSVGVALLLEYLGIVLVVGWLWLRHHQRPRRLTVLGVALSIAGLVLVLDVFGGFRIDALGVMWGLLAAIGLATYYVVSADDRSGLPGLVVAGGGLLVGAAGLLLAWAVGLTDMTMATGDVVLAGVRVPWWVDVLGLAVVAAALAYVTGIAASRRLGSKLASFVGLSEVLAAVLLAWLLLGELPAPVQLVGGLFIVAGVVAVKADERPTG